MLEYTDVIGVDEVGRGPLFGEVVACALYIKNIDNEVFNLINDSKKLSEKKREYIYNILVNSNDVVYEVASASAAEIDEINILNASLLAMKRAVEKLNIKDKKVLVDGNKLIKGYSGEQDCLIKGDSKNLAIAAASIIAKVCRDRSMLEYAKKYPLYSFEKHKGYPTKKHYEAIKELGVLKEHRKTFLKGDKK